MPPFQPAGWKSVPRPRCTIPSLTWQTDDGVVCPEPRVPLSVLMYGLSICHRRRLVWIADRRTRFALPRIYMDSSRLVLMSGKLPVIGTILLSAAMSARPLVAIGDMIERLCDRLRMCICTSMPM